MEIAPNAVPAYRGALCRAVLGRLSTESYGAAVLARAPRESIRAVKTSGALSWVPAEHLDALTQAQVAEVGRSACVVFWRDYMPHAMKSTLFGPFFSGAFGIFGKRPEGLLGWVSRTWNATTRAYGRVSSDGRPGCFELVLNDCPEEGCAASVAAALEGSLLGILNLSGRDGRVSLEMDSAAPCRTISLRLSWNP